MGRIKTTFVKAKSKELFALHGDKFTTTFDENKKLVDNYTKVYCKKIRNIIAGYMTRLKRMDERSS